MKKSISSQVGPRAYPSARQGVADSQRHTVTEQTASPAYRLAFADDEFLVRDEMRGVRLELEWSKADVLQRDCGIESTIVIFGSARVLPPDEARERLEAARQAAEQAPDDAEAQRQLRIAETAAEHSRYYQMARDLARIVSATCQAENSRDFVVTTGGGPGIMEAANRGAHDVGAQNVGHNIVLPHEQAPNPYITPELCFQFHYFAVRKMHFLARARALVCFPGGFGTMDELFEALTLIQTGKVRRIPVLLVDEERWRRLINLEQLRDEGYISPADLELFEYVENAEDAWKRICGFYQINGNGNGGDRQPEAG